MKILLTCSSGVSTSLLERAMTEHIKENDLKDTMVDSKGIEIAKQSVNEYDIVLLAPQVQYELSDFKKIANGNTVIELISRAAYANANTKTIFRQIRTSIK